MIQLTYYLNCKIKPNHCIQSIETYLATLTSKDKLEFNDVKEFMNDEAEFGIKVDLSSDIENLNNINYCKITRDNVTRYYFITSKQWRSENVYLFGLELDVVNTYQEDVMNKDLYKQVKISRRHKDRWIKDHDNYYNRLFDKVDEGFGEVTGEVESKTDLTTEKNYVAYKVLTTTDYVHNYTDKIIKYFVPNLTKSITTNQNKTDIVQGDFYAGLGKILLYKNTDTIFKIAIQLKNGKKHWFYANGFVLRNRYEISASTLKVTAYIDIYPIRMNNSGNFYVLDKVTYSVGGLDTTILVCFDYLSAFGTSEFYVCGQNDTGDLSIGSSYDISGYYTYKRTATPTSVTDTINGYNALNKVDSQLLQLQELPIGASNCINFGDNELVCNNEIASASKIISLDINQKSIVKAPQTRTKIFESKLYGSYVRKHTIMYDSFGLEAQPEYMLNPNALVSEITFALNMSNNFMISSSSISESKPYSNIVLGSRNNQATIYTSDYLNYMRTGYNYDQKQRSLQKIQSTINLTASLLGAGSKAAGTAASEKLNVYEKSASIAGTAVGAVNTISNNIIANIKNDENLAHKRQEAMNNTPNLNGSDDLALFNSYSGNKLIYCVQKPVDEVLNSIYDLFYYSGYADNLYYNDMPTIKTRDYFNYLQCDIGYINISNHKERIRILEAFQEGITFEWYYNNTWLLEGTEYENWETSIS
jgi:hypothetical protein